MKPLTVVACLLLGGYAVARALLVPLTYDEAATYLRYISTDILAVFNFEVATNHFLNTLATKLAAAVAGDSELVLRLPSLIGYALYLFFSIGILRAISQRTIAVAGFVLLHLNPYLFDYFALSRGYGISLGLLTGALYFLLRFASQPQADCAGRDLSRALTFGCGAVLAGFSLLAAYVGIVAVVSVLGFQAAGSPSRPASRPRPSWFVRFVPLSLTAVVFTFLVLSQDSRLTHRLYEPVTISLVGLDEAELAAVSVSRTDLRRRPEAVTRQPGTSIWRVEPPVAVSGLRIELPLSAAEKLRDRRAFAEAVIGIRPYILRGGPDGPWTEHNAGSMVVFESNAALALSRSRMAQFAPVINWAGDGNHLWWVASFTARVLALLGALAAALALIGWLLRRAGMASAEVWRPVMMGLLWLAALAGTPLYLLRRNGELYFGGVRGFVEDTIYSLIEGSFYDRTYVAAQSHIVFAVVIAAVAAFGVVGFLCVRRGDRQPATSAACLLGVLAVASAAAIGQSRLLDTPFLLGRTALFFIPLFVLFATFLLDAMARLGRVGKRLALSAALVSATLAVAHFAVTANVSYTLDWRHDAGTKAMIDDLAGVIGAERPGSPVVLGVTRHFSAAAAFYARKCRTATIEVHTIPATKSVDFFYVDERNVGSLTVIKRYPVADAVLAR